MLLVLMVLVMGMLVAYGFDISPRQLVSIHRLKDSRPRMRQLMVAKNKESKPSFYCTSCGTDHIKWVGQCSVCAEWNTVKEFRVPKFAASGRSAGNDKRRAEDSMVKPMLMQDINLNESTSRLFVRSSELHRVLGGGIVKGSVVLMAGDPGVGKSTMLMQIGCDTIKMYKDQLNEHISVIYISGEETLEQLASRAQRLGLAAEGMHLVCDTRLDRTCKFVWVDSAGL
jgi:DNA repair protein RadA/Sms